MNVALIGSQGQLGSDLASCLNDVTALTRDQLDITDENSVRNCLANIDADIVINAAAYNFVDKAEDEPDLAYRANALGPWCLAKLCAEEDKTLVHVSSDYVFAGDRQRSKPYDETDRPTPTSAYAISKLAGEQYVQAYCPKHFVVRTCGLYGHAALRGRGKGNFVETMLRLGSERDQLSIVDDQRCTPTATADLAKGIVDLLKSNEFGLYHLTNDGDMTWFEFAAEIFRAAGIDVELTPITTEQFGAQADRPRYSVLSNNRAQQLGISLPHWKDALGEYLAERNG